LYSVFIFQLDEEEAFIISFFDLFDDVTHHFQMDPAASSVIKVSHSLEALRLCRGDCAVYRRSIR